MRGYSGLAVPTPTFAGLFFLFGLASFGGPGTAAFASEDLILHGGLANHLVPLLLFLGAVSLQGYAVLHLFFRVFLGPVTEVRVLDAMPRERLMLFGLAALLLTTGLAPQLLVSGCLEAQPADMDGSPHAWRGPGFEVRHDDALVASLATERRLPEFGSVPTDAALQAPIGSQGGVRWVTSASFMLRGNGYNPSPHPWSPPWSPGSPSPSLAPASARSPCSPSATPSPSRSPTRPPWR